MGEVNQAIAELLVRLNDRPFRKREGCRRSLFESLDKPALRRLPAERYEYGDWETHRVNIDYHVEFDNHWYSVPYQFTQQEVEVRATATTVEIFHRGVRVASHARSYVPHVATTVNEHRPKAHQRHLEWTPSRLVDWAQKIGPATADLFDRIMASKRHPGTRLPLLSRHSAALQAVLTGARGGGCAPRDRARRLLLPEHQIDSAVQSGQPADRAGGPAEAAAGPPQHSRLGILRHR